MEYKTAICQSICFGALSLLSNTYLCRCWQYLVVLAENESRSIVFPLLTSNSSDCCIHFIHCRNKHFDSISFMKTDFVTWITCDFAVFFYPLCKFILKLQQCFDWQCISEWLTYRCSKHCWGDWKWFLLFYLNKEISLFFYPNLKVLVSAF